MGALLLRPHNGAVTHHLFTDTSRESAGRARAAPCSLTPMGGAPRPAGPPQGTYPRPGATETPDATEHDDWAEMRSLQSEIACASALLRVGGRDLPTGRPRGAQLTSAQHADVAETGKRAHAGSAGPPWLPPPMTGVAGVARGPSSRGAPLGGQCEGGAAASDARKGSMQRSRRMAERSDLGPGWKSHRGEAVVRHATTRHSARHLTVSALPHCRGRPKDPPPQPSFMGAQPRTCATACSSAWHRHAPWPNCVGIPPPFLRSATYPRLPTLQVLAAEAFLP